MGSGQADLAPGLSPEAISMGTPGSWAVSVQAPEAHRHWHPAASCGDVASVAPAD